MPQDRPKWVDDSVARLIQSRERSDRVALSTFIGANHKCVGGSFTEYVIVGSAMNAGAQGHTVVRLPALY
jgi:hypothetical protein